MRLGIGLIVGALAISLTGYLSTRLALADEHESHHRGGAGAGMMGEMGGEMGGEHGRSTREFYPSLMNLSELNADQRAQLDQAAQQRMSDGARLMSRGVDRLSNPENSASMREGTALIREGLDEFQSGLAAREALEAGGSPQTVALNWFRQQLNLPSGSEEPESNTLLGLSPFHLFSMALLIVVAVAAIWIYFLRMRRARALMLSLAPAGAAPAPATPAGQASRGESPSAGAAAPPTLSRHLSSRPQ